MKSILLRLSAIILTVLGCTRSSDFIVNPPPRAPFVQKNSPGILEGVVVNQHGGLGLENVQIAVRALEGGALVATVSTNARGEFSVPDLKAGKYVVSFVRSDFQPHANAEILIVSDRRTYYHTTMTQGLETETFTFNQRALAAKVDILFIVDNSTSMTEEQAKLSTALSSFIPSLGRIDWQIGVTTTDVSDGPFGIKGNLVTMDGTTKKFIDKTTPGYEEVFRQTVTREETLGCENRGNCPSGDERPLEAISLAVSKRNAENAGFFRDGADLAVVVLSDEDERSNGLWGAMKPADLQSNVTSALGAGRTFSAYGILIQPGDQQCLWENGIGRGYYGTYVTELARITGGVTGSICNTDFGPSLENIGKRVLELVKSVTLARTPIPATVQLKITPDDPTLTWVVVGNQINFNHAPNPGTVIEVSYVPQP